MSENEEIKQKVVEWFQQHAKPGKTKFYLKDVVKDLSADYDKRAIQKAVNDCTVDGTLSYWSTGSSTMFCLPEHFNE